MRGTIAAPSAMRRRSARNDAAASICDSSSTSPTSGSLASPEMCSVRSVPDAPPSRTSKIAASARASASRSACSMRTKPRAPTGR